MPETIPSTRNPLTPIRPAGWPYEALCRYAIASEFNAAPEFVKADKLPGPARTGKRVKHQIDLFWTTENALCKFLIFANVKYRNGKHKKIQLCDIMTLLGVMREISAQKVMLITNTGYTKSVIQLAQDHGIALLVIKPLIPLDNLTTGDYPLVVHDFQSRAAQQQSPVYDLKVILKSWTPPSCLRASVPSCLPESDLSYLIASPDTDYFPDTIDDKSMSGHTPNKMIQNAPNPEPPPPLPFGIRTK